MPFSFITISCKMKGKKEIWSLKSEKKGKLDILKKQL